MVLASFAFTSLMLAEDTTSDVLIVHHQNHGWQRIPRHQSYKADRLSWCAALPLCRATTTCHGLSSAFVKEEERYFFPRWTDTSPRGVILWGVRSSGHVILTWSRGCGCNTPDTILVPPLVTRREQGSEFTKVLLIKKSRQIRRSFSSLENKISPSRAGLTLRIGYFVIGNLINQLFSDWV